MNKLEKYKIINNCQHCTNGYLYEKIYEPFKKVKTWVCIKCSRQYKLEVDGTFVPIRLEGFNES